MDKTQANGHQHDFKNTLLSRLKEIFAKNIDDPALRGEAWRLCSKYIGGLWKAISADDIVIRVQTGGMNNFIFIVSVTESFRKASEEPTAVILRIYFSEDIECTLVDSIISVILSERGIGPAVLGVFPGGRIEEYIPSRIITNEELCNIHVGYEVGKILATVHSLNVAISKENRLDTVVDEMVSRLRSSSKWKKSHKMRTTLTKWEENLFPSKITVDLLAEEYELAKRCAAHSGSPVVFTNNDLHEGNLLLRDGVKITKEGIFGCPTGLAPLVLIDYEYGGYYYRGFDFCHYCCECCQDNTNEKWPGYRIMEDHWPDDSHQRRYAEGYLDQIEMQAEDFPVDAAKYDFFEYGFDRLAVYYKWKSEMTKYLKLE
ncbi:unnamed protein product [Enterobius vermicularis]|uniref:Choline/ethanolamine kinase n=1 Tax=Enterobius vermicularis TaxID=51028 RepID=A0A0N4VNX7_ENTVE|nr:unnamed protein product [Enterobius vermicularis]